MLQYGIKSEMKSIKIAKLKCSIKTVLKCCNTMAYFYFNKLNFSTNSSPGLRRRAWKDEEQILNRIKEFIN